MKNDSTIQKSIAKERKLAKKKDTEKFGYIFILPFFVVFAIFSLYPTIYTIFLSFTDLAGWAKEYTLVGFSNFINVFNNQLFRQSVFNTFVLWIINFIPQILLAFVLAYWFTNKRLNLKRVNLWRSIFYLPNIITAASVALIFYALFSFPRGPLNLLFVEWGIFEAPYDFFRNQTITRLIVSFIQFWMWYGQTTIVLMAGVLSIDESLFEAAKVDGATDWQSFIKITLPLLKPITLYVLITSLIGGLQMFDIPLLLTNGGPNGSVETMMTFIYKQAFQGGRNLNIAATGSVILLLITVFLSLFVFNLFKERKGKGEK